MALTPIIDSSPGFAPAVALYQGHRPAVTLPASLEARRPDTERGAGAQSLQPLISCRGVSVSYGGRCALDAVDVEIGQGEVLALIGPSGSGKSTFLRCLNRMNDSLPGCQVQGKIVLNGRDIHASDMDAMGLRSRVGMVLNKPNPYPQSVYDNIAYGLRIHGLSTCSSHELALIEEALREAGLWQELRGQLTQSAQSLSPGQQQRLCIARALAIKSTVLLMDEPCAALDPVSTAMIEGLIEDLGRSHAIVLVPHSTQQAARISQRTAFFHSGRLIEVDETARIFTNPRHRLTEAFISGQLS